MSDIAGTAKREQELHAAYLRGFYAAIDKAATGMEYVAADFAPGTTNELALMMAAEARERYHLMARQAAESIRGIKP